MAKHKWHKEIKAWADGGDVQFNVGGDWHDWRYNFEPHWDVKEYKFRTKPQPKDEKPKYLYVYADSADPSDVRIGIKDAGASWENCIGKIKLEVDDVGSA